MKTAVKIFIVAIVISVVAAVAATIVAKNRNSEGNNSQSTVGSALESGSNTVGESENNPGSTSDSEKESGKDSETEIETSGESTETSDENSSEDEEVRYSQGLEFLVNDDGKTCNVIGIGTCTDSDIIIPPVCPDGHDVTVVYDYGFRNCSGITGIIIPEGVTAIRGTFTGCDNITKIEIPDSIISFSDYSGCNKLEYNEYDNAYYLGNKRNKYVALIKAKDTNITSCVVNENTKMIASEAFKGCGALTDITIPDNIKSIGIHAFWDCDSLKYNEYDNICYLGNSENKYLVLARHKNQTTAPGPINEKTKIILDMAFFGNMVIRDIVIPDNVISLGEMAFESCYALRSVKIGKGLSTISGGAFSACKDLESVEFGSNVTSIQGGAFSDCEKLKSITLPDKLTYLGGNVFQECKSLISIVIPGGVPTVDYSAFAYCPNLESVTIKSGVKYIRYNAFQDCVKLKSIVIPDTITEIDSDTFSSCESLTDIHYGGTKEQFKSFFKENALNRLMEQCLIHCSDGDMTKE